MTTVVPEFWKFIYNLIPAVMGTSVDIFQSKLDKILGDIKGIKTYINGILVLIKERFYNHIYQLRVIFSRLRSTGLKVNSPNCIFWLN